MLLDVHGKPFSLPTLPYVNFVYRFPPHLSSLEKREETLSIAFLSLLELCVSTLRDKSDFSGNPSYNVIFTLKYMYMVPRSEDNYILSDTGNLLPVNALGFAGMLLVRSEEELESVHKEGIGRILQTVGLRLTMVDK